MPATADTSKTQHTPGPWATRAAGPRRFTIHGKDGVLAGDFQGSILRTAEELEANERLIEAAPDLLEACREYHNALDILFAMLIERDHDFRPSKSPAWKAAVTGNDAMVKATGIAKAEGDKTLPPLAASDFGL